MKYWFQRLIMKRLVSILRFSPAKVASNPLFIRFCSFKMNCRSTVTFIVTFIVTCHHNHKHYTYQFEGWKRDLSMDLKHLSSKGHPQTRKIMDDIASRLNKCTCGTLNFGAFPNDYKALSP